ncbi:MAG: hypothetical protein QM582_08580 [Micropruina sp.]|uniref:ABC transporter permease subunit n=1 Tax=Micropruina sp. TaxID=2737536 RepID=UPI0039E3A5C6
MNRLIGAELNRWFSRRLCWVVLLSCVALAVLVVAGVAYGSRPMEGAELAAAEQDYAEAAKQAEQEKAACLAEGLPAEECDTWTPRRSDFVREPPAYPDLAGGLGQAGGLISAYAALLLGASFLGAEFKTGSLGTWLTYVPSRVPVLASKAIAALAGTALLGVLVIGILQAGAAGIVLTWSGSEALLPAPDAWAMTGRGFVLVLGAGLLGFALAGLLGSTVGPIGVLLGVLVLQWATQVLSLLFGGVWLQAAMPDPNIQAFLNGGAEISYVERAANGEMVTKSFELGQAQASAYLGGLMVLLGAAATWRFAKREIR